MTTNRNVVPAVIPLALLESRTITILTDAYMHAFSALHSEELDRRKQARARLAAELATLDLFAPSPHYNNHEDYIPEGDAS